MVFRPVAIDLASKDHASCVFDAEMYGCFDPRRGSVQTGSRSLGYDMIIARGKCKNEPGSWQPNGIELGVNYERTGRDDLPPWRG